MHSLECGGPYYVTSRVVLAGIVVASAMLMASMPAPTPVPVPGPALGYHDAVSEFKRRLIEATLLEARGNRTHAAKTLGLQRTYLLRLIRDLGVAAPPPPPRGRNGAIQPG